MNYFSDRECGKKPQTRIELTPGAWRGIAALIRTKIDDGSFGIRFPETCFDGPAICGTNEESFWDTLRAEIPNLADKNRILLEPEPPPLLTVMDMIEFCWKSVGEAKKIFYHSFGEGHHHLTFGQEAGRSQFQDDINLIFERNELAYVLTEVGQIERLIPQEMGDAIHHAYFQTGDVTLDRMLETARQKFLRPDEKNRHEALKDLWDAWERLKTIYIEDKKRGTETLLNEVAEANDTKFREMLEDEAKSLTKMGNTFEIRHSETNQERLVSTNHVDYLFHRLFSLIYLVLQATGRRNLS